MRRDNPTHRWRGGRVAEGGGLLNRYTVNPVSWVRIPSPPPPFLSTIEITDPIRSSYAGWLWRSDPSVRAGSPWPRAVSRSTIVTLRRKFLPGDDRGRALQLSRPKREQGDGPNAILRLTNGRFRIEPILGSR